MINRRGGVMMMGRGKSIGEGGVKEMGRGGVKKIVRGRRMGRMMIEGVGPTLMLPSISPTHTSPPSSVYLHTHTGCLHFL